MERHQTAGTVGLQQFQEGAPTGGVLSAQEIEVIAWKTSQALGPASMRGAEGQEEDHEPNETVERGRRFNGTYLLPYVSRCL